MLNIENTFVNPAALTNSGYEAPHRFLILGLGESGLAMAKWCLRNGAQVRVCEYTNYCEALDQHHEVVTCQLWDRLDLGEPGIAKTPDGKRRLTPPRWLADGSRSLPD
jgi:hypothetical protein